MGTTLPPNEPGSPVAECWGLSGVFGPGSTPRIVFATFEGMLPGELWVPADGSNLNRMFQLTQTPGDPDTWTYDFGNWIVQWGRYASWWFAGLTYNYPVWAFLHLTTNACNLHFDNAYQGFAGNHWYGGSCQISWDLEGL